MKSRGKGGEDHLYRKPDVDLRDAVFNRYSITKSAMAATDDFAGLGVGPHNIQVNCIAPGFNPDATQPRHVASGDMKQWLEASESELGEPADLAPLAVFLAGAGPITSPARLSR